MVPHAIVDNAILFVSLAFFLLYCSQQHSQCSSPVNIIRVTRKLPGKSYVDFFLFFICRFFEKFWLAGAVPQTPGFWLRGAKPPATPAKNDRP